MERIRHIAETQKPHTYDGETSHERPEFDKQEGGAIKEIHPEQVRVRECLDEIDEDLLEEIFLEYIRRSGTDEDTVNWIPFDEIKLVYKAPEQEKEDPSPLGAYEADHSITLFAHLLETSNKVLFTAIHEQLHAVSAADSGYETSTTFWNTTVSSKTKTGINTYEYKNSKSLADEIDSENVKSGASVTEKGDVPNEGLTEFITQEIFYEYGLRSGKVSEEEVYQERMEGPYFANQLSVELYTRILAMISQVPLDTVKNGMIRTYLRNGDVMPTEMKAELDEKNPELVTKVTSLLEDADPFKSAPLAVELYKAGLISDQDAELLFEILDAASSERIEFLEQRKS